jgi:hypothetical protein
MHRYGLAWQCHLQYNRLPTICHLVNVIFCYIFRDLLLGYQQEFFCGLTVSSDLHTPRSNPDLSIASLPQLQKLQHNLKHAAQEDFSATMAVQPTL